jgi:hypothetical protein
MKKGMTRDQRALIDTGAGYQLKRETARRRIIL